MFVWRQTGNREDALDLTQECFLAMLRSLASYDAKKAGFRTWLYHIATHKVIDMRRKQQTQFFPPLEDDCPDTQAVTPDFAGDLYNKQLLEQMEELVRRASPHLQELFRLRVYGEYSFPEIAAAVSVPEAKIKAQYYRFVSKLKKELINHDSIS